MWDTKQIETRIRGSLRSIGIDLPAHWPELKALLAEKKDEVVTEYQERGDGDIVDYAVNVLLSDAMDVLPTGTVNGLPTRPIEQINGQRITTHMGLQEVTSRLKEDLIAKWVDRFREHSGQFPPTSELDKATLVVNICVDTCCPDESQMDLTKKGKVLDKWYGEAIKRAEILLAVPPLPEDIQEEYLAHFKRQRVNLENEIQSAAKIMSIRQEGRAVTRSQANTTACDDASDSGVNNSVTSTETQDKRTSSLDMGLNKRQKTADGPEVAIRKAPIADDDPGKQPLMEDVELVYEGEGLPSDAYDPSKPGPSRRRSVPAPPCRDPRLVDPVPEAAATTPRRTKRPRRPLSRNIWSGGCDNQRVPLPLGEEDFEDDAAASQPLDPSPESYPAQPCNDPTNASSEPPLEPVPLSYSPNPECDPIFSNPGCDYEVEPFLDKDTEGQEGLQQEGNGEGPFDRPEIFEPVPWTDEDLKVLMR